MLEVREAILDDVKHIADYWLGSDKEYLVGMGVDLNKLPKRKEFVKMLSAQIALPIKEKQSYALVWMVDGVAIGHCNINGIEFGECAYMHLHIWNADERRRGVGAALLEKSLPFFFNNYELKRLYCEPYADNPAPHRVLEKVGFVLEKEYMTTPGSICFEQPVKRWVKYGL